MYTWNLCNSHFLNDAKTAIRVKVKAWKNSLQKRCNGFIKSEWMKKRDIWIISFILLNPRQFWENHWKGLIRRVLRLALWSRAMGLWPGQAQSASLHSMSAPLFFLLFLLITAAECRDHAGTWWLSSQRQLTAYLFVLFWVFFANCMVEYSRVLRHYFSNFYSESTK